MTTMDDTMTLCSCFRQLDESLAETHRCRLAAHGATQQYLAEEFCALYDVLRDLEDSLHSARQEYLCDDAALSSSLHSEDSEAAYREWLQLTWEASECDRILSDLEKARCEKFPIRIEELVADEELQRWSAWILEAQAFQWCVTSNVVALEEIIGRESILKAEAKEHMRVFAALSKFVEDVLLDGIITIGRAVQDGRGELVRVTHSLETAQQALMAELQEVDLLRKAFSGTCATASRLLVASDVPHSPSTYKFGR